MPVQHVHYFQLSVAFRSLPPGGCSLQLDTAGIWVRDVSEDATGECAWPIWIADHQPTLPERHDGALDVWHFKAKMIE